MNKLMFRFMLIVLKKMQHEEDRRQDSQIAALIKDLEYEVSK